MKPNIRELKAFARLDYNGRIVAGSLILRKKMPRVGKWIELPAYECCNDPGVNTTTTTYTTTTTCVPEGDFVATIPFASSYTPALGDVVSFIDSQSEMCEAIPIVDIDLGSFNYFDVDSYVNGEINYYYLSGTCTLLPTGFYVFDLDDIFGCHILNGVMDGYNLCTTTTTTTTIIQG